MEITPRQLQIEHDKHEVCWEDSGDLSVGLVTLRREHHFTLPSTANDGYVLIALNVDGGDWDHVVTQMPTGQGSDCRNLIREAIQALELALRGIDRTIQAAESTTDR